MLLTLIIILLLIWAAVVGSIYSSFLVFYDNFNESENYNKAYYAAISALERGELVIRQRAPWYEWSWWWKSIWNINAWASDAQMDKFSYFSTGGSRDTSLLWEITSLTDRIPASGKGNVDWIMSTGDSNNYNIMDYENAEIFLLYKDNSDKQPYTGWSISSVQLSKIEWKIRLPGKLSEVLGILDTDKSISSTSIKNDAIVDWQIRGNYSWSLFTVFATQSVDLKNKTTKDDSAIRETEINGGNNEYISFWNSKTPIWKFNRSPNPKSNPDSLTIVWKYEDVLAGKEFDDIFMNSSISWLQLRLSLLNLLKTHQSLNHTGLVYPFLEYYFEFKDSNNNWAKIPDKYYTINSEWQFWDYQVKLVIQKPTIKESILWSFTVIF